MKRFYKFTEDVDKVAALKAKQRATVDKLSLIHISEPTRLR